MKTEAAIIVGAIEALLLAILAYIGYKLEMQPDELLLLGAIVAPAMVVVGAIITRLNVFSGATYEKDVAEALKTPPPEDSTGA